MQLKTLNNHWWAEWCNLCVYMASVGTMVFYCVTLDPMLCLSMRLQDCISGYIIPIIAPRYDYPTPTHLCRKAYHIFCIIRETDHWMLHIGLLKCITHCIALLLWLDSLIVIKSVLDLSGVKSVLWIFQLCVKHQWLLG